tara:strand:- start:80 stop:541 length:462 start_codon:yes stop_codon:yes gene_type:complete
VNNKDDKDKWKEGELFRWEKKQDKEEVIRLKEIIAENLGIKIDAIKDESNLVNDLGADSLNQVEIVIAIEKEFDIEISDDDADTLLTVGELKQHIADAEKIDRVVKAEKNPSIFSRDNPLFFGKDRQLHNFWIGILLFLFFIFFGINTDYKYR